MNVLKETDEGKGKDDQGNDQVFEHARSELGTPQDGVVQSL